MVTRKLTTGAVVVGTTWVDDVDDRIDDLYLHTVNMLSNVAGTSIAYTATASPALTVDTLVDGVRVTFRPHVTCGTNATLAIDGLAARALKRSNGSADGVNVVAGDLIANDTYDFEVHTTYFMLISSPTYIEDGSITQAKLSPAVSGVIDEVVAARDGLINLDTRLDALRDAGLATQAEVTAAREGEASLDAKLDLMESSAAATTAEVVAARDGLVNLDTRLDALRDAGLATQAEVTAAREGEASLDAKLDVMESAAAATTAEVVAARSGAASLDARIDGIATDLDVAEASIYEAQSDASYAYFDDERSKRNGSLPKALVLILIGQSNNTSMGTQISTIVSNDAYMPVGGNQTTSNSIHGDFIASAAVHTEDGGESPLSGAITTLIGGNFTRIYAVTVAVGGTTLDTLGAGTPKCNLYAAAYRLCDLARAAGYNPVVVFSVHQGEADMVALASESDYYADGRRYYRMCQCAAAQAMERPDYVAPIVFHHPIHMYSGTDGAESRGIHSAIRRLAKDIPNAIYGGPSYHFDSNSDRNHNSPAGFRNRGEHVGYLLRRFISEGFRELPLEVVDVTWGGGTSATVLFNHEVTRDTTYDWGTNLDTANALGGFEWVDNGSLIQITVLTVQGRKVVLTLASTPSGTVEQQKLRIASQTTTSTPTVGSNNRSGSQMRVNETGRLSIYSYGDAKYGTHYRWAVPQLCDVRAA